MLEIIITILKIAISSLVFFFIVIKILRLLKKKSYHYIIPPEPEEDLDWYPVDFSKYKCFIFIKNLSEEFIVTKLDVILRSKSESIQLNENDIWLQKYKQWIVLRIDNASFVAFKSLVWWLEINSDNIESPSNTIGFCKHKINPSQDYIFKIDKVLKEDNFIGSFRTGKNFGIYLPNSALNESGNISLSRNKEIDFYDEVSKLPIECIDKEMNNYNDYIYTTANNA